jgi:hypothetical protein
VKLEAVCAPSNLQKMQVAVRARKGEVLAEAVQISVWGKLFQAKTALKKKNPCSLAGASP